MGIPRGTSRSKWRRGHGVTDETYFTWGLYLVWGVGCHRYNSFSCDRTMRRKVKPVMVDGACGWCKGRVLRNYKNKRGYQKCLECGRVSWQTR